MTIEVTLRPATMADAELLLEWRNEAATRAASHRAEFVSSQEHASWLRRSLDRDDRRLYIVLEDGVPVGTVRTDAGEDATELSWTVAPTARGRGLGSRMVCLLVDLQSGPVRAEIKSSNEASIRIAESAGLRLERKEGEILHYRRDALS